ncbi:hypothetical protein [Yersinia pseudotuberculosis]|uniref:hypothetical protein n=1 Tax=Yersinia pseudotuberculosis TaxID=633 RepID=UPI0005DAD20A|nr:hypothetical protein [Yersinia pseudotuberculosis]CND36309.1 Uncharacterised protein [Yersinia pseudotuberculosis]
MTKTHEQPKKNKTPDTTENNLPYEHNTQQKYPDINNRPSCSATEGSQEKKVLVVGYSPTGGGHTGRTLEIVTHAIEHRTIDKNYLVILYVPPLWDGKERPKILNKCIEDLLNKGIKVKVIESEKPVYGYLNPETGGSNDAKILERIALQPLRNKLNNIFFDEKIADKEKSELLQKYKFLEEYFGKPIKLTEKITEIEYEVKNKYKDKKIDNLQRMQANTLLLGLVNKYGKDNIKVLSDMDPALQKAAKKSGIKGSNRLDQQNHAILLDLNDPFNKNNLNKKNAVLAKVLGGRGEKISHISLGGKNTLNTVNEALKNLGITETSTIREVKSKIYDILMINSVDANEINQEITTPYVGVVRGNNIITANDIEKVIYIYAHSKTNIILKHIIKQIQKNESDYGKKVFIFCGSNAIPNYNAMHLAYLIDADGITTSGAGTSGEFVYLHKHAGAQSNLLSLAIEGHNEQQKITKELYEYPDTKHHMVPKNIHDINNESLEENIDELVGKTVSNENDTITSFKDFHNALKNEETYVKQAHDILFGGSELSEESIKYRKTQKKMYENENLKGTRKYIKLVFQLLNILTENQNPFPINIEFSEGENEPGLELINIHKTRKIFQYDWLMKKELGLLREDDVKDLPLIEEVRTLINSENYTNKDEFEKLKESFGHYMTTGF